NRIAKENIFSGLNNVDVYTVLDKKYSEYFGITEPEIKELLYYNDMELTDEVKKWYDGYRIGGYEVYNPWSIINYVNRKELQPYWVNTASNDLIIECLRKSDNIFKDKFSKLLNYESIKVRIEKEMTYEMLDMEDNIWGLFMNAGYITLAGENTGFIDYNIKIPNYEIQLEFEKIVAISANMTSGYLYDMFQALLENNIELFVYRYKLLLIQVMSYHDNRENAYHMFMLGLCASLRNIYTVKSNLEVGLGRSDIILIPKDKKYHPIIMEFKAAGKEDIEKLAPMEKPAVSGNTLDSVDDMDSRNTPETLALETLANEAIKQIKDKEYNKVFEGKGFKDTLLMGIGHHKKQCVVKTEYLKI
ncbi:MAG TPA: AAA family ATPase, partial [Clostridiaceae bacterium]|nr:AAA family ATPase [Clostridiaceae bacterium]